MALTKVEVAKNVLQLAGDVGNALDDDKITAGEMVAIVTKRMQEILKDIAD